MHTIQIDDQVFDVLQRTAAVLVEPSPNKVLRRVLLVDPILATLPDAPWPSPFEALDRRADVTVADSATPDANTAVPGARDVVEMSPGVKDAESSMPRPLPLGAIPPPRFERPAEPGRVPAWVPLSDVVRGGGSVAAHAGDLPPGLRQAFDVIHLIVRHRIPRPEAIRRVSDLRRAAGARTDGPRLTLTAKDFDRMVWQRGRKDLRKLLKSTFPDSRRAVDAFLDELSEASQSQSAS